MDSTWHNEVRPSLFPLFDDPQTSLTTPPSTGFPSRSMTNLSILWAFPSAISLRAKSQGFPSL